MNKNSNDMELKENKILNLEESGISEAELQNASDFRRYQLLMDSKLYPEDYEEYFEDYRKIHQNYELLERLCNRGVGYEDFVSKSEKEKIDLLLSLSIDPLEYIDYFEDYWKWDSHVRSYHEMKEDGIDYASFIGLSDTDKVNLLVGKGIAPEKYEIYFSDYLSQSARTDAMMDIVSHKIDIWWFLELEDQDKMRFLIGEDLKPVDYEVLFANYPDVSDKADAFLCLKGCGIDPFWFEQQTDDEKQYVLVEHGLNPEGFEEFFLDYEEICSNNTALKNLHSHKIDIRRFMRVSSKEKDIMLAEGKLSRTAYESLY